MSYVRPALTRIEYYSIISGGAIFALSGIAALLNVKNALTILVLGIGQLNSTLSFGVLPVWSGPVLFLGLGGLCVIFALFAKDAYIDSESGNLVAAMECPECGSMIPHSKWEREAIGTGLQAAQCPECEWLFR